MRKTVFVLLLALACTVLSAREDRRPFQTEYNKVADKEVLFKTGGDWFPYPEYSDRKAWEELTAPFAKQLIKSGENYLDFKWELEPASFYLDYESGKSKTNKDKTTAKRTALTCLTLAELCEGKGRFLPQIIDGMFHFAVIPTWNTPGETVRNRKTKRTLPEPDFRLVSLQSASTGALIAICLHFFKDEFDKVDPSIAKTVYRGLELNIFNPFLDDSLTNNGQEWFGIGRKGQKMGNWTTYCNMHALTAFLLCENDPLTLRRAMEKSLQSMDLYMDYAKLDGSCEEGPSYWNMAGAKVYDYSRMMFDFTAGAINLLKDEQLRRMAEWKSKTFIGDGWVTAFADGQAYSYGNSAIHYRIGKDIGSQEMIDLGIYLSANSKKKTFTKENLDNDIYRCLQTMRYQKDFEKEQKKALNKAGGDFELMKRSLRKSATSEWYQDNQHAILRNQNGWYVAAKGGNNNEAHNHNDIGSGIVFYDNCPVIIDAGAATYTKDTFGKNRYKAWNVQSCWHNCPTVNGEDQPKGAEYKAEGSECNVAQGIFSTDISKTYPVEASCTKWKRTWALDSKSVSISDEFALSSRKDADCENFLTNGKVYLPGETVGSYKVKNGEVLIEIHSFDSSVNYVIRMTCSTTVLTPSVEVKEIEDKRLSKMWGNELRRLRFTSAPDAPLTGSYSFTFTLVR